MKKAIVLCGWGFFLLFVLLGMVAWVSLPPRVFVTLGSELPAAPPNDGAPLQSSVLDLEERVEDLEDTLELVTQEITRLGENWSGAESASSRDHQALDQIRAEIGGLSRQTETLTQLLAALLARDRAAASVPLPPPEPDDSESELRAEPAGPAAGLSSDPTPPVAGQAAEARGTEPTVPPGIDGASPNDPERAPGEEVVAGQAVREAVSFSDLLARKRWRLWEEPTTFKVLSGASVVWFDGSSTVHDFTGSTSVVSGFLRFDFSGPSRDPEAEILVDARNLNTRDEGRDEEMHTEYLESAKYPEIRFTLSSVKEALPAPDGSSLRAVAVGVFEVHGNQHTAEVPVSLTKQPGRRLLLEGRCALRMTDFGIEPPTALAGLIKTRDDVTVRVRIVAEAVRS
ncbi:MAG: YceI family protein [Planctomycetota bacterium]